jgi:S1-C subfamily serine protease
MPTRDQEEIPRGAQPKAEDYAFDLDQALMSIVSVRSTIPEDALTARTLGPERAGHGVVINDKGLILTIGYLVTEAESIWLVDGKGRATAGYSLGFDQTTGFGLIQALGALDLPHLEFGSSKDLRVDEKVILAGAGGRENSVVAEVVSKREFAGYWEYVLDEAIFTAPPHPTWGGAGLIGEDGTLRGIGSLFVQQMSGGDSTDCNMVVPIDLLKPILSDLQKFGRVQKPPRPWLGMLATEMDEKLVVAGIVDAGPARSADVRVGDFVVGVNGSPVTELAELFRAVWALGEAGVDVPLNLIRDDDQLEISIHSVNRADLLKAPQLH